MYVALHVQAKETLRLADYEYNITANRTCHAMHALELGLTERFEARSKCEG